MSPFYPILLCGGRAFNTDPASSDTEVQQPGFIPPSNNPPSTTDSENEETECVECGVSTHGRRIRSLWNNTLCEKCGEMVDCENCGEPIDPNDARKCNVYDPRRCKGTCCDGCCVDGFSFCEHCQDGYDSDHERDLYDMLAVEGETLPKGDACYGSRLRSRKTLTLIMAGGGSHWWNYVVEDDKVYIENSEGRDSGGIETGREGRGRNFFSKIGARAVRGE